MILEEIRNILAILGAGVLIMIALLVIDGIKERMKRRCPVCGIKYNFLDRYCRHCGKNLNEVE